MANDNQDDYEPPDLFNTNSSSTQKKVTSQVVAKDTDDYEPPDLFGKNISRPAAPLSSESSPTHSLSDYDQAIKTSLGLAGSGAGAYSAYKGKSLPNPLNILKPGEGVFSPVFNSSEQPIQSQGNLPSSNPEDSSTYFGERTKPRDSASRYLNSQLGNDNVTLTPEQLQNLSGTDAINNNSDIQAAIKKLSAQPVSRTAKIGSIDPKTGIPRKIFTTTPATQAVDLSPYEKPPSGTGVFSPVGTNENTAASDAQMAYLRNKNSQPLPTSPEEFEQIANKAARDAKFNGLINGASKIGTNAVGAGSALAGAYDTYNYANSRDNGWGAGRTITKGMSTLGGLAQMTPIPAVRAIGSALQLPESVMNTKDTINDPTSTPYSKFTKGLSTAGLGAMMVPTPFTEAAGAAAQIPEGARQVWNLPDYYNPSTDKNRPHAH